jgi:hypothetical protein
METGLPLKGSTATTGGIENVVEIASASSGKMSGDTKSEDDPAAENSASTESSLKLPELLNFFRFPIVLLLAVLIVALCLKYKNFKKRTRNEDFDDFENLDDEKHRPEN